jgi:NitT/TauT family transport system ATP-binding protein
MQQRVSIIRAVLSGAKTILLDEPFSNSDFVMRRALQKDVSRFVGEESLIAILVTHDLDEAIRIADKVIVLSERPSHVKGVVSIPISREERLNANANVLQEMADYVERLEEIFLPAPTATMFHQGKDV